MGYLKKLSSKRRALLEVLLQEKGLDSLPIERISRRKNGAPVPLSFAQARLWFLDELMSGSPLFNIFTALRLQGSLNVTAFEQSLNEIIKRHEALRTNFVQVDGQPFQVIAPTLTLNLPVVNLRDFPKVERETEVLRLAYEEARRPFNLAQDQLLRATLIQLSETENVVLFTIHHIVSDDWSIGILIRELTVLYEAFDRGQQSLLPELPIQYADFTLWQRQWLEKEVQQTQLSYWKQQLGSHLPLLQLPTDRPRPVVATFRGASQSFSLTASLSEALKALSRQEDVTLFMTLLAAFKILLSRYTGSDDIVVGSPIANRNRAEIEQVIGCFVNTLVLRTDLSGNATFRELLCRVREVTLGAYAHQDLPFEKLVEELQTQRNLSYTPLFQVMFVIQDNVSMSALELSGLTWSSFKSDNGTTKFDLTLHMTELGGELVGTLEYNSDLFEANTITRLAGHLQTLLEGIVANPDQYLNDLPLLTLAEQQQLLEWNQTQADHKTDACHQLFEAQVEQTPDAVAVIFEDKQLTYRELNHRANQVAHYLRRLGVKPEVLVGICVERSLEMVVGLLGIFKAGGAYVPLDPAYPQERLAFMLSDSQVPVLLTQARLVESLPPHQAKVVCLDTNWDAIAQHSQENLISGVTTKNLAYVIYTSGSTGRPKGVMNTHMGLCNRLLWMQSAYQLTIADRVLQKTSFSFDVSVWEFFWPLLFGACLVVAQPGGHQDSAYLVKLIASQQITTIHFVPSMLQVFLEEQGLEPCNCLKRVICSGEALPLGLRERFFARLVDVELHNLYGPTEAAIDVTFWNCKRQSNLPIVPIGRPITNTQIYILDSKGQTVPVGVPGELHIGGDQLARGYLNHSELTAEKFIPNPFRDSDRLYKTGDLARYRQDGNIEFLGRIDNQVKVRGFRIELGEIEAVLGQHPALCEVVVLAREDVPGDKRLVAYVVGNASGKDGQESFPSSSELRSFLKEKLPDYMLPSAFVMLEALPLTPNGKVNRRSLPAPDTARPELESILVPPHTPVEEVLAGIWSDVLRRDSVGVNDNFFELGGDSLLSLQIISRANQAGLKLIPRQLFQHQTIAELAAVAGINQIPQAEQVVVTGALPLTPIQHWFFEQDLPEPHHWNQAVLLEVRQALNLAVLEKVVRHLLIHHDALRLCFERQSSSWQQINAGADETVPLTRVDFSALSAAEQGAAIEAAAAELQASLILSKGSLVRLTLFDLGADQPNRLLIVIHHLAVDGVSWRILLADLEAAYQQLSRGETVHLPSKTTSFKHWAERLTEYAKSGNLQQELYWLTESRTRVCTLPVDYLEGDNTEASACTVSVSLSAEETQALLQEVPQAYNTQINDVLLTALVQVFGQWSGSRSLLVDLEGHGREEIFEDVDLSRTVGWFTTVFPILLNLEEACYPGEELKSVKEQLRRIPNRGIGYGLLRYLSGDAEIAAKLRSLPQAEVIFNYLGQVDQVFSGSSLFLLTKESSGPSHSLKGSRRYLLEVNGLVIGSQLQLNWTYSKNVHQRATVEGLAEDFLQALRSLIAHCQSPDAGGFTPSDFPLAQLDQNELDEAFARVEFKEDVQDECKKY